jgi:O-antigen/teichoic acid export membrane protein
VTGLVTYAYFALASHALGRDDYGRITLLWSVIFAVVSVLYRPVEQMLSRTIADRDARGVRGYEHLRVAATIQLALGLLFAGAALALRHPLEHGLFGGSSTLYWILIVAVVAYAASYFARGFLAGNYRLGLYGGLVLMESCSRCTFSILAVAGVATSQGFVATGMAAAPIVSLSVVPWAIGRRIRLESRAGDVRAGEAADVAALEEPPGEAEFTLAHGTGFATAVLLIMLSEQAFLNAGPLLVKATAHAHAAAVAGFAFNVLLIARAPLQLFQAIQTSILPHLTKLSTSGQVDPFRRSVAITIKLIAAFAAAVAVAVLAVGPPAMHVIFGKHHDYGRLGLVLVAIGMGVYLAAATLNQAALARGRTRQAAICWVAAALAFVIFMLIPIGSDRVLQVEAGYLGGATLLCVLLYALYRR